jgi:hypothetical protein
MHQWEPYPVHLPESCCHFYLQLFKQKWLANLTQHGVAKLGFIWGPNLTISKD